MMLQGGARDLVTTASGTSIAAAATMTAAIENRMVVSMSATPAHAHAEVLVGAKGGGGFRARLRAELAEEFAAGAPLYFLLDDVAAMTLIGGFAWHLWPLPPSDQGADRKNLAIRDMADICSGFRSDGGPIARQRAGVVMGHNIAAAVDVVDRQDPLSWHDVPPPAPQTPCMRRRRRVDVQAHGAEYRIDAMFRDAMWSPEGVETVVHEYALAATVDAASMILTDIEATARVLPFAECPAAAANVTRLIGQPMSKLRDSVLEIITGTSCCTHLNDMLRALAEVPVLAAHLEANVA